MLSNKICFNDNSTFDKKGDTSVKSDVISFLAKYGRIKATEEDQG